MNWLNHSNGRRLWILLCILGTCIQKRTKFTNLDVGSTRWEWKLEVINDVPNSQDNVANIQGKRILSMVELSKKWKELFPNNEKVPYICEKTF